MRILFLLLLVSSFGLAQVGEPDQRTAPEAYAIALEHQQQGQYPQALKWFSKTLELAPEHLGALWERGNLYGELEQYDQALADLKRITALNNELPGPFGNMGWYLLLQGKAVVARQPLSRAMALDPENGTWPVNLGHSFLLSGDTVEARRYYEQGLALLHSLQELREGPLADFDLFIEKGWNIQACRKMSTLLEQRFLQHCHPLLLTADSLDQAIAGYQAAGENGRAIAAARLRLQILQKLRGEPHSEVALARAQLATLLREERNYGESEGLYRRSLQSLIQLKGEYSFEAGMLQESLGLLLQEQGRYWEAESLYSRALEIKRKWAGSDPEEIAKTLNYLATLYDHQGRYNDAEVHYLRAIQIQIKKYGNRHVKLTAYLNNLAVLYSAQGRYAEAEQILKESLAIREKEWGENHPEAAGTLNNLAGLYSAQGRYALAQKTYQQALAIRKTALGNDHPDYAVTLSNLAGVYRSQGKYGQAERLYRQALAIKQAAFGNGHPKLIVSLNNLASLFRDMGRSLEADSLYRSLLDITRQRFGTEHPDYFTGLINLGWSAYSQKTYKSALRLCQEAEKLLPAVAMNPALRASLHELKGLANHQLNHSEEALVDLARAIDCAEQMRPQVGGGEETRAGYFQRYAGLFDRMISWQISRGNFERALEYAERGRARTLLDQLAAGKIDLREGIPPEQRQVLENRENRLLMRKAEYQQRIASLRARNDLETAEKQARLQELQNQLREAEEAFQAVYEEIKNASWLWRDLLTSGGQPVSRFHIQSRLIPSGGMLLMYQLGEEESFLFLLPPLPQAGICVPLRIDSSVANILHLAAGNLTAAKLQTLLAGGDSSATSLGLISLLSRNARVSLERVEGAGAPSDIRQLQALFRTLLPDTLWTKVRNASEAIIIPDGPLNLLPFEALVIRPASTPMKTRFWLDEGPPIRYVASATVLYNIEQRPARRPIANFHSPQILSLSDPVYNVAEVRELQQDRSPQREEVTPEPNLGTPGEALGKQYQRLGGTLKRLPGTARESRALQEVFAVEGEHSELRVLQRLSATEALLRQHLPGKRYLHLATHGIIDQAHRTSFASLALTPPAGDSLSSHNDGFLQLYEIYRLNLSDCELAVLSACETNVGRYVEGEGVFALTRGFLAAGARRVVASQWAVDDASTADIIGDFFRHIALSEKAAKGVDYATALRNAKRKVRQQDKWADPFYWAPFVLTGKR